MELTSVKNIKNLLESRQAKPSRGLGQNFLTDKAAIRKIVEAADLQPDDVVLEIGPGLGVLTQELAKRTKKVIAVEKDRNMVEILKETLKDFKNVEIIYGDILKLVPGNSKSEALNPKQYLNSNFQNSKRGLDLKFGILDLFRISNLEFSAFKVVGNLPFYLTAHLIRQLLENVEAKPTDMTLVVQKEVAQRICAKPPDLNLLAVSVQFYAEPKIISYISRNSFWPSPEVDAAILKIISKPQDLQRPDVRKFFKIVKAGFSQPRKQLINNLSRGLDAGKEKIGEWLMENNIQPTQRAETLSIDDWRNLTKSFRIK
ncbi:MAG: ribosomal RNA small subunit methyltransferase A [Candidatus Nealsonbacteria bacterium]|nr:ribosomal RNA small subunit methyltransferase A [Candidatus Nealsonbacteria bacterium]